jgi:hypothetical protein
MTSVMSKGLAAVSVSPSNRFSGGLKNRDRCYEFLNIFAEKFSEKIGVFDSKQR